MIWLLPTAFAVAIIFVLFIRGRDGDREYEEVLKALKQNPDEAHERAKGKDQGMFIKNDWYE